MLAKALPFTLAFALVPLVAAAAAWGGWWIAGPFAFGWLGIGLLDRLMSLDTRNLDPAMRESLLFWHKLVTWSWVPTQIGLMAFTFRQIGAGGFSAWEIVGIGAALGVATGGIGITFAHELVHQRNRWERWAGEVLLASVGYGHFATEHVHGHHVNVATAQDPVSARKGESFPAFFPRAVAGGLASAWRIECARLRRRGLSPWHRTNAFWRYGFGLAGFLGLAVWLAGAWGLAVFAVQAYVAIFQLEAVNYVEHYGLERRQGADGRYERVALHHSWNAAHRMSNWVLINLQRHSDHHCRPDRRFPLLQHHDDRKAPQLPLSYAMMIMISQVPPLWFRMMNPRVEHWRRTFYPDIAEWNDPGSSDRRE